MAKKTIRLPYRFAWRSYQKEMWDAMIHVTPSGEVKLLKDRADLVWHRRAGKDKNCINFMIFMAYRHRVGTYYYVFPTYSQGKKILWDGIGKDGMRFIDHFPPELIYSTNETELQVILKHPTERGEDGSAKPGSICQIIGSDNVDSVVGTNPVGLIFSEYSLQSPKVWKYFQPILAENAGWAIFVQTPRGENHAHQLWKSIKDDPHWFTSLKTIDDTIRDADGEKDFGLPVVTRERVERDKKEGMDEETALQEYWCSWHTAVRGSYYGNLITKARREGRVCPLELDPFRSVLAWWDIGRNDTTAIWFVQPVGKVLHWFDYYEKAGEGLPHFAAEIKRRDYPIAYHAMPHDIGVTEWAADVKRSDAARKLGIRPIRIAPKRAPQEGIEVVRSIIPISYFNSRTLDEYALNAMMHYHKEWDDDRQTYLNTPEHDWSSNLADAARTGAVLYRPDDEMVFHTSRVHQTKCDSEYDIFAGATE